VLLKSLWVDRGTGCEGLGSEEKGDGFVPVQKMFSGLCEGSYEARVHPRSNMWTLNLGLCCVMGDAHGQLVMFSGYEKVSQLHEGQGTSASEEPTLEHLYPKGPHPRTPQPQRPLSAAPTRPATEVDTTTPNQPGRTRAGGRGLGGVRPGLSEFHALDLHRDPLGLPIHKADLELAKTFPLCSDRSPGVPPHVWPPVLASLPPPVSGVRPGKPPREIPGESKEEGAEKQGRWRREVARAPLFKLLPTPSSSTERTSMGQGLALLLVLALGLLPPGRGKQGCLGRRGLRREERWEKEGAQKR
jgi:hypothetical protein